MTSAARSPDPTQLSRRERQIMDIVYREGEVSAAEVQEELADPPSYSSVRTHLRILEEKGYLTHRQEGQRYVYRPTTPRSKARASALARVLETFFDDSVETAVAALLDLKSTRLSDEELDRLSELVEAAKKREEP
jgi:predicted transcriptional regulator